MRRIVGLVMGIGFLYAQSVVAGELVRYEHDMQVAYKQSASSKKSSYSAKSTKTSKASKTNKQSQYHKQQRRPKNYGTNTYEDRSYGAVRKPTKRIDYDNRRRAGYEGSAPAPRKTSLDEEEKMRIQMDRMRDHH